MSVNESCGFMELPKELYSVVNSYCDNDSINQLRLTNSYIKTLFDELRATWFLSTPKFSSREESNQIMIDLLKKFINIKTLNFSSDLTFYKKELKNFTKYVGINFPRNLSELNLHECSLYYPGYFYLMDNPDYDSYKRLLNLDLFNAFGHSQLVNLKISDDDDSILGDDFLDQLLKKSINLKSISYEICDGSVFARSKLINFSLSNCLSLQKNKLNRIEIYN